MDTNVDELLVRIVEQQSELLVELRSQRKTGKDFWDRLTAISPILSAVIIACIGAYFTYSYNLQALKMQEIQTVERFIPHLVGNERTKRAAILAISSMGNATLAAKMASMFASEGTASALQSIAQNGEEKDQAVIKEALYKTLDVLAEKYKTEGRDRAELEQVLETALAGKEQDTKPALERPTVEAVHAKQPEPRSNANNSVETNEAENQPARPALAESTHSKQQ